MLLENRRVSPKSFAFSSKNSAFSGVFSPFLAHWREKINSRSSTLFATRECRQDSPPTSYYISVGLNEATPKKNGIRKLRLQQTKMAKPTSLRRCETAPAVAFRPLPHRTRRGERPCFAQPRNENGKQKKGRSPIR